MNIKFQKLAPNAVIPTRAHATDAGFDLTATSRHFDEYGAVVYGTGIALAIPDGYVGLVFPRSSISKFDLTVANAVGVIDSGYRGEILVKFKPALLYCDNIVIRDPDNLPTEPDAFCGSVQTDPDTQSVSARGLDSTFFGKYPTILSGRATTEFEWGHGTKTLTTMDMRIYNVGERIAQLIIMPLPEVTFEETDTLEHGERGANGYGSTGR